MNFLCQGLSPAKRVLFPTSLFPFPNNFPKILNLIFLTQCLHKARKTSSGISLSTCFSLFSPTEICALLTQCEREGYGHNTCKRTCLSLFDTQEIPESASKSLLTTSAAPQGRELGIAIGYVWDPAAVCCKSNHAPGFSFCIIYVSLIIAFLFFFPKSSAL